MANGIPSLLNPAGGLSYHWRAVRHQRRWRPFCCAIETWLCNWHPRERHLVVVGPSAGYTLPIGWLARFESVTCLEPDPLARWLLARRVRHGTGHGTPQLSFMGDDHLVGAPERLVGLVRSLDAALLFSNVLGQLSHLLGPNAPDASLQGIKAGVRQACRGRSWASYHDRLSGAARPHLPEQGKYAERRLDDSELTALYGARTDTVTLFDHASDGFFDPSLPHAYFSWEITPGYFHLIEGVSAQG